MGAYYIFLIEEYVNPVVALNSASGPEALLGGAWAGGKRVETAF
jgi:hypothetical protein